MDAGTVHVTLAADLRVDRARIRLDLTMSVATSEVVALLGPNGAGKSTVLRCLAGLEPALRGRVVVDDVVLDDAGAGIRTPPERRPVGVVFQDYLLFPHLSVAANVAFGLRARGASKRAAAERTTQLLDRLGLTALATERPRRLSGGQAQRVALARALAVQPRLLLLDEPLAALDAATRLTVRADLKRDIATFGGTTVLVTHDPIDAMVLADRVVVIEDGRVVQEGAPLDVARAPRTDYVARLVGLNLVRGIARGHEVDVGTVTVAIAQRASGEVLVSFAPSAVALYPDRPGGSPRNTWRAIVDGVEPHGDVVRVRLSGAFPLLADVTPGAVADLGLRAGAGVWAVVKATETRAYPA
jgi:molybdate transport system ATP-binding protein